MDFATIILLLAYTVARPAEFVNALKSTVSQDPLSKLETSASKYPRLPKNTNAATSDYSSYENNSNIPNEDSFDKDLFKEDLFNNELGFLENNESLSDSDNKGYTNITCD